MTQDDKYIDGFFAVGKIIRDAAEQLEDVLKEHKLGTRRHCELQLAWHHLIDASILMMKGRLSPEDMQWAIDTAKEIEDCGAKALVDTGEVFRMCEP